MKYKFEIQGHRGARGTFPENSLPGFLFAIEAGTPVLELDLMMTLDEEVIIHHDITVNHARCLPFTEDRTPRRFISDYLLAEIKELDYGSLQNDLFPHQKMIPGTTVPTLNELVDLIKSSPHPNAKYVLLNLEIKADPCFHSEEEIGKLVEKVLSLIKDKNFNNRVYYSSFSLPVLSYLRKLDSQASLGFVFDLESLSTLYHGPDWVDFVIKVAKDLNIAILSPDKVLVDELLVKRFHSHCFRVIPWTVNDFNQCKQFRDFNVDGIITDYPLQMLEFFEIVKRNLEIEQTVRSEKFHMARGTT